MKTREQRIELIRKVIDKLDYDMFDSIHDDAIDERERSLFEDKYPDDCNKPIRYYELSKVEAVESAYIHNYCSYFENEEEGIDFVEHYYGEFTNEFYEELEEACKQVVAEFTDRMIEEFFYIFDPMKEFG